MCEVITIIVSSFILNSFEYIIVVIIIFYVQKAYIDTLIWIVDPVNYLCDKILSWKIWTLNRL